MQMAASAFDILIESVSDNIGLRWVWTNQRCNRTACIHRMQFKGLTFPTSVWQRKNGLCIYEDTACNNYEASQCASQIWKLFSNQDRPFSSSTWSGRLFFLRKFSHLQSQQAGIQHKNALVPHLNGRWISKFSWKNSFLKNRRWFIQYHTKPELLLPVLKAKSGSITS